MRIAQVAPLYESVPPRYYGGTERIVSHLTEELVRLGHDVTLFASGDSVTAAKLIAPTARALRLTACEAPLAHHVVLLEQVMQRASQFDVIHHHVDYLHFPLSRRLAVPQLTTLHGRLDMPDLQAVYDEFGELPVVSISDAQRRPLPQARWIGTVHHGLPPSLYEPQLEPGRYLAFLGRISPEKRVDRAIEIATRVGIPLKIAAKVDPADRDYYEREIRHLMDHPLVTFVGEIGEQDKQEFLAGALALLFPIDWPEPFGLVVIEAMACGTPVIAFRNGSVPELIEHGVNGFIVDDMEAAIEAVRRSRDIDRRGCREHFDRRFTVERMANDYVELYQELAGLVKAQQLMMNGPLVRTNVHL